MAKQPKMVSAPRCCECFTSLSHMFHVSPWTDLPDKMTLGEIMIARMGMIDHDPSQEGKMAAIYQ